MKNTIIVIIVIILLISAWVLIYKPFEKEQEQAIWQGAYYEHGLEENELYGPIFNNFKGCKTWALAQIIYEDDVVTCSKNCHDALADGTPVCEEVVRNWAPFSGSYTFDTYQE